MRAFSISRNSMRRNICAFYTCYNDCYSNQVRALIDKHDADWRIRRNWAPTHSCLDNKALNRSVRCVRVGQSSDGRNLPLYPTTVFTNSSLFDASVNAGVIQIEP